MCGIAGLVDLTGAMSEAALSRTAKAMSDTLRHRGPDEGNVWVDAGAGVAFGHRRLSIVDLSAAGRQPMVSASGRSIIAYNGEVYNADELTAGLAAGPGCANPKMRGRSDTEALLESCEHHGVVRAVRQAIGMFAFALWDRETRRLSLLRDRLGIKPLYWFHEPGRRLAFASELRAFHALDDFAPEIDRDALALYFRFAYVPAPFTIWKGVRQLLPGHSLDFHPRKHATSGPPDTDAFWSLADVVREAEPFDGSDDDAVAEADTLIRDAVRRRMVADVPLGALLSGGIDSSTVVAAMQAQSTQPVRTFAIGFDVANYDEAPHAKAVAQHLGTDHTELYVTAEHAREVIPQLPSIYDQPFADSSQIPTYLVSQLARDHVTVALSGDGGDEVFAGYNRHIQAHRLGAHLDTVPHALRALGARGLRGLSPQGWERALSLVPSRAKPHAVGEKLHKVADVLDAPDGGAYARLISQWPDPAALLPGTNVLPTAETAPSLADNLSSAMAAMQFRDTLGYMPGDVLTKVDRASMAVSLEVRVPLIDHRLVAFAWRLPERMKVRDGKGKWLLRQVLDRYVPRHLIERPKMGFGVPIDQWLRGPLRDWAEDLLSPSALRDAGIADATVRGAWTAHLSGRENNQHRLWTVLMYQAWRAQVSGEPPERAGETSDA